MSQTGNSLPVLQDLQLKNELSVRALLLGCFNFLFFSLYGSDALIHGASNFPPMDKQSAVQMQNRESNLSRYTRLSIIFLTHTHTLVISFMLNLYSRVLFFFLFGSSVILKSISRIDYYCSCFLFLWVLGNLLFSSWISAYTCILFLSSLTSMFFYAVLARDGYCSKK